LKEDKESKRKTHLTLLFGSQHHREVRRRAVAGKLRTYGATQRRTDFLVSRTTPKFNRFLGVGLQSTKFVRENAKGETGEPKNFGVGSRHQKVPGRRSHDTKIPDYQFQTEFWCRKMTPKRSGQE
jgi:hypothetical protein